MYFCEPWERHPKFVLISACCPLLFPTHLQDTLKIKEVGSSETLVLIVRVFTQIHGGCACNTFLSQSSFFIKITTFTLDRFSCHFVFVCLIFWK